MYEAMFPGEQKSTAEEGEKEELIDPLPGKLKKAVVRSLYQLLTNSFLECQFVIFKVPIVDT